MSKKSKKVYRPKKENEIKLNSYLIKNKDELGIGIQQKLVR